MGLMMHAQHLDHMFGAGPHTISIPRMRPADHAPDAIRPPAAVNDLDFKKLVAIIRCSVPYTGMILSTRETPEMRHALLQMGISQMSAGSMTTIGGYYRGDGEAEAKLKKEKEAADKGQFQVDDHRNLDQVVHDLMKDGFVPSWCTACYRLGRTGAAFMKIAKKGDIHNYCHPNALLTLNEYLHDYAKPATKALGQEVIQKEKDSVLNESKKKLMERKLKRVDEGDRDVYI
jgi:2-iminoacetate synthase